MRTCGFLSETPCESTRKQAIQAKRDCSAATACERTTRESRLAARWTRSMQSSHARAVCRRAERSCVELAASEQINPEIVRFLNRLSDLLFVMARVANHRAGRPDVIWEAGA